MNRMNNEFTNKKFRKLLDKLQQDSWQLELLISGFAIFGLFSSLETIEIIINKAVILDIKHKSFFFAMVIFSCYILIFNLLLHLTLRGLWIGALGLRYVSGDIEFDKLNYENRFENYLKKKIISFDKYIATLENYCSIMFAVSFLLIFYIVSFFMIILIISIIIKFILSNENLPELFRNILGNGLLLVVAFGSFLTLVDFFTQGLLKKKKILAKIYFPFYWLFSFLTLSFLYRPLVYNFLDNKFSRRISMVLVPLYLTIVSFTGLEYQNSNYLDSQLSNKQISLNKENYDDMLTTEFDLVESATIQSKLISEDYIKIFCAYKNEIENEIFEFYPSLIPKKDNRGYNINLSDSSMLSRKRDSLSTKYLEMFNKINQIYIGSTIYKHDFLISKNNKNQLGFETYINVKNLTEGKHLLKINRLKIVDNDTISITKTKIPFWYFKD